MCFCRGPGGPRAASRSNQWGAFPSPLPSLNCFSTPPYPPSIFKNNNNKAQWGTRNCVTGTDNRTCWPCGPRSPAPPEEGARGGWGCRAAAHRDTPGRTRLSDRWSQVLCRWCQPRAGNAGQAAAASTALGQCTWAQALRQAGKATCPCLAHGSPRAWGREGGGDIGSQPSSSSVSSRFGLCAPKSTKSSPRLPSAAPKVILTKDRIRVSPRSGLGQDGPQWHPGCLCPRPTVHNN